LKPLIFSDFRTRYGLKVATIANIQRETAVLLSHADSVAYRVLALKTMVKTTWLLIRIRKMYMIILSALFYWKDLIQSI